MVTRIHIRSHLGGLNVEPDKIVLQGECVIRVRQYGTLAFGRWFYNRICTAMDRDYQKLPSPIIDVPPPSAQAPTETSPAATFTATVGDGREEFVDGLADLQATDRSLLNRARLVDQLCSCVTPNPDPSTIPEFFTRPSRKLPRYIENPLQSAKAAEAALLSLQIRIALLTLHGMKKAG